MNNFKYSTCIFNWLIVAVIGVLIFLPHVASAVTVEEINSQIQDVKSQREILEKKIEQQQKKVDEVRAQAVTLQNQISLIDNRVAKIELDIQSINKQIQILELEVEALTLTIKATENKIQKQKELIAEFVRLLHREDRDNYIEILILNNSFSEFFNRVKNITSVTNELERALTNLSETKQDLERQQRAVQKNKASLEKLEEGLLAEQEELRGEINQRANILLETRSSEVRFQRLLSGLRAQYQAVEDEIRTFESRLRDQLASSDVFKETGEIALTWPTDGRYITAYFHDPDYPFRYVFEHNAVDIRAAQRSPVRAAASGYVARAKRCASSSCYSFVMIIHSGGVSTVYGHLSAIEVTEEQFVTRGQIIGYSGGTPGTVGAGPFVTGPHLHFETRVNGIPVNPLDYLLNL